MNHAISDEERDRAIQENFYADYPHLRPANPSDPLAPVNLNDVVIPGDTWTSGKILPVPRRDTPEVDQFLVVEKGGVLDIADYWFKSSQWVNSYGNDIEVSAWRRIPMDGIDEAVRQGDA